MPWERRSSDEGRGCHRPLHLWAAAHPWSTVRLRINDGLGSVIARVVAVVSMTIAALPLSMGVAYAPLLPPSEFYPDARLDRTQVIDQHDCRKVRHVTVNGHRWAYCPNRPSDVWLDPKEGR